ncbi:uncharacterized protein TNCV_3513261 [Trichonephila clavipes]|nr:uncharacterized protein TNCV_3513261 [Trichonephila clavipes]
MFPTPVETSMFMRRREGNPNCWSSGIQASMIESPVNSLFRNPYSCGDCECRTQCSGSTAPLTSRTYYQISVLSLEITDWSTFRIRDTLVCDRDDSSISTILLFVNMSSWRLCAFINLG